MRLLLACPLSPGDILTMTAAIHSLHRTYPGEYLTDVDTPCPALFEHNHDVTRLDRTDPRVRRIAMHYPSIHRSNRELVPFLGGYTEYLGEQLGRPLRLATNRPHLYLSDEEAALPPAIEPPYWIVNAGVKSDFPLKQWPVEHYQAVVDWFGGRLAFVQVGERHHSHPRLAGVVNLIGRTTTRELVRLVYHAAGGVGPITFLQHLCAAWQKPYVALLGGREPVPWVTYPQQHTLHTVGAAWAPAEGCCRSGACWRGKLSECARPVREGLARPVGQCMARIKPEEVIRVIERGLA